MDSLEKKMLIIPNKLSVNNDKIFVSFDLKSIPRDMSITSIILHLPINKTSKSTNVYIRELMKEWSEKEIKDGYFPPRTKEKQILKCSPKQEEILADISKFGNKWRVSRKHNYGIYIRLKNVNIEYVENNPPFLIIDTI